MVAAPLLLQPLLAEGTRRLVDVADNITAAEAVVGEVATGETFLLKQPNSCP